MTTRKRERTQEADNVDNTQYKLGDRLQCRWRNATRQDHPCEIIEIRFNEESQKNEYYVHYLEFNRRLDEWVTADRFISAVDKSSLALEKVNSTSQKTTGRTRLQKKKEVTNDDGHGDKDDHSQHDDISKVKNIK
jgi:histone acetyltransferase MYST1